MYNLHCRIAICRSATAHSYGRAAADASRDFPPRPVSRQKRESRQFGIRKDDTGSFGFPQGAAEPTAPGRKKADRKPESGRNGRFRGGVSFSEEQKNGSESRKTGDIIGVAGAVRSFCRPGRCGETTSFEHLNRSPADSPF